MLVPMLATKLFIPPARPHAVVRSRLTARLNDGLASGHRLALISAAAGFGKTTLVGEWISGCGLPVAWLSLDEADNDLPRFLYYLIAALQTIRAQVGAGLMGALQLPRPPSSETILTTLLNEIAATPDDFVLFLDDYHVIEARAVDEAIAFLLAHMPPQMHLAIATRSDPNLPLARMRARSQLTELRAADLRFAPEEAVDFLNRVMGLTLPTDAVSALEERTEGWIAGLQLAALSMRGCEDVAGFIASFTGSHHFVLDYLMKEVLEEQAENIQQFLLRTSILERLCGPLCDAVTGSPSGFGQETLEHLERANMFIVPLDNERKWYRYHHLFGELLRQRLHQGASAGKEEREVAEYHVRASGWYEANGPGMDAFRHAAAANDIERAERIIEGKGIPLHFRGAVRAILDWLASLPSAVLDARPSLCVRYATLSLVAGQTAGVEEKLQAAENAIALALQDAEPDQRSRDLIGQIAASRATMALTRYDPDAMLREAGRALEYLAPDNFFPRIRAIWTRGFAYEVLGERSAAGQAYSEAIDISRTSGNIRMLIVATISLGAIQEMENRLHEAAEMFRTGLQLAGEHPQPFENEAHLGLARIFYQWNDLAAAEKHAELALQLAHQYESTIDRYVLCDLFRARLKLTRGDISGAATLVAETERSVVGNNFLHRIPEVAAAQVLVLLKQGDLTAAEKLARKHDLPASRARVLLARREPPAALALLSPLREKLEAKGWQDQKLVVMVLQSLALRAHGETEKAASQLEEALALAERAGYVRLFLDEGAPMADLLSVAATRKTVPAYARRLLEAFATEKQTSAGAPAEPVEAEPARPAATLLAEPLSRRELEVLRLLAEGLSNQEIGDRLFVALDTIKGHNRRIFEKLEVKRRTEAIARARSLGLL